MLNVSDSDSELPPPGRIRRTIIQEGLPPATISKTWFWVALAAAAAIALGAFLPWASVMTGFGSVSVDGVGGNRDGMFTLAAGVIIAVLAFAGHESNSKKVPVAIGILGAIALLIALNDVGRINSVISTMDTTYVHAEVGAGLYVTMLGGVLGIVAAFLHRRNA